MKKYNIIVLGGGSGGLVVALGAARMGLRVALIEKNKLGGDCLWTGCVPSKALLHSAKVAQTIREAHHFGLGEMKPEFASSDVLEHVRDVQAKIGEHDAPERFREKGVEVIFGSPRFLDPHRIQVGDRIMESKKFVLATGGRPHVFPIPGLKETGYISNENVFLLQDLPVSLIHIGGGPISIELCQAFTRLGVKVTVLDKAPQIMPREDGDMVAVIRKRLEDEGVRFATGVDITGVKKDGDKKVVTYEKDGKVEEVRADDILVALGRAANVDGLDLEKAGVEYTPKGVEVDDHLRTTAKNIWAVGDVKNKFLFTHVAEFEARIVVQNALFPFKKKANYRVVPWTTFTDPELARVGLSEDEAKKAGVESKVLRFPYGEVDRAVTDGETEGMAKIICGKKGMVLGAAIVGANAGELIHEWVLAIQANIPVTTISGMIHVYPTLSRLSRKVADKYYEDILAGWKGKMLDKLARLFN